MVSLVDRIASFFKPSSIPKNNFSCDSYYSSSEGELVLNLQEFASYYPDFEVGGHIHKNRNGLELLDLILGNESSIFIPRYSFAFASWHSHPQNHPLSLPFSNPLFPVANLPSESDISHFFGSDYKMDFIIGPLYTVVLKKPANYRPNPFNFYNVLKRLYEDLLDENFIFYDGTFGTLISESLGLNVTILRNEIIGEDYISFLEDEMGGLDGAFKYSEKYFGLKPGIYRST